MVNSPSLGSPVFDIINEPSQNKEAVWSSTSVASCPRSRNRTGRSNCARVKYRTGKNPKIPFFSFPRNKIEVLWNEQHGFLNIHLPTLTLLLASLEQCIHAEFGCFSSNSPMLPSRPDKEIIIKNKEHCVYEYMICILTYSPSQEGISPKMMQVKSVTVV